MNHQDGTLFLSLLVFLWVASTEVFEELRA